jgi:hypothetical protein
MARAAAPRRVGEWLLIDGPRLKPNRPNTGWLTSTRASEFAVWCVWPKARWRIELDYRELKEELGLDHYEGRHWLGWHHHVCLVSLAYAFLRSEQARVKKNFWCDLALSEEESAGLAD